jgi:hypothetical protein
MTPVKLPAHRSQLRVHLVLIKRKRTADDCGDAAILRGNERPDDHASTLRKELNLMAKDGEMTHEYMGISGD